MLSAIWLRFNFHVSAQSGFYFDYLYNRISEIFVSLIFVYMAQFFGENFMIEVWTNNFFFFSTNYFNNFINVTNLNYFWFFFHLLIISIYLISFIYILMFFLI